MTSGTQPDSPVGGDGVETGAGSAAPGLTAGSERDTTPETAESESGRKAPPEFWAAVEALAAQLEPEAFDPDQPALIGWRKRTQAEALAHAAKVIELGWRRVSVDDDTVERVARAMWFGPPAWDARIVQEEYAPIWRAKARAAVQALRDRPSEHASGPGSDLRQRDETAGQDTASGDLVEWNPVGDQWLAADVVTRTGGHVSIKLRENGQVLTVEDRHLRQALRDGSGT